MRRTYIPYLPRTARLLPGSAVVAVVAAAAAAAAADRRSAVE